MIELEGMADMVFPAETSESDASKCPNSERAGFCQFTHAALHALRVQRDASLTKAADIECVHLLRWKDASGGEQDPSIRDQWG